MITLLMVFRSVTMKNNEKKLNIICTKSIQVYPTPKKKKQVKIDKK